MGRGALSLGWVPLLPSGRAAVFAKGNDEKIYGRSVANRQDTNFSRIRDVAPIEHSLPEARGWLCMQRCAGGDARTSAGSSHVLRMMKFSSKQWQEVALMMLQG